MTKTYFSKKVPIEIMIIEDGSNPLPDPGIWTDKEPPGYTEPYLDVHHRPNWNKIEDRWEVVPLTAEEEERSFDLVDQIVLHKREIAQLRVDIEELKAWKSELEAKT